jgi:hypothetical protein
MRTISRTRRHTPLAAIALGVLALIAPARLSGQGLDHDVSTPLCGPSVSVARAGVSPLTPARTSIASPARTARTEQAQDDSSGHHGSRAHHAAVGAVVGGTTGLVFGLVVDRMWFGAGEARGHFQHLWHVTAPFGALVGALAGTLRQAD